MSDFSENREYEGQPEEVLKLIAERNKFRDVHNWEEADKLRSEIEKAGWQVEDTKNGVRVKKMIKGKSR